VTSASLAVTSAGERMVQLATRLFPLCRSITGDGVRATLREIGERIALDVHEVASGTPVLDWTVPDEWNIADAYIATEDGSRVVDFQDSNLHVVSYSEPVDAHMSLAELLPHLHTHEQEADWIPYRTSYYTRTWGFCLARRVLDELADVHYRVVIDSSLAPGSLTYGECVVSGEVEDEVLLTTHVCHPSLANDNVSGIVLLTELAAVLAARRNRLSYRFLFIPGTIGSLTWLARSEELLPRIVGGLVVACVGDDAPLTYKRSRRGDAAVDRAASHVVSRTFGGRLLDFVPWGWDERQFNSPGFDLPVGCLTRSLEGEFDGYHSSADDLAMITPEQLEAALDAALAICDVLEGEATYRNLVPKGEPQLGRRGLYRAVGGGAADNAQLALLWVLNQSDGGRSLLEIAERADLPFELIREAADRLEAAQLLERVQ
jgi:aminopeptidase-like protein